MLELFHLFSKRTLIQSTQIYFPTYTCLSDVDIFNLK